MTETPEIASDAIHAAVYAEFAAAVEAGELDDPQETPTTTEEEAA